MSDALAFQLERCRPWIEDALAAAGGLYDFVHVADEVLKGKAQLWPGVGAVMVTQITDYPNARIMHVWLGGGDMRELMLMQSGMDAYARSMGCHYGTIEGREGWSRALDGQFETVGVILRKAL